MKQEVKPVSIRILDKEYLIACPEEERQVLLTSADYLNRKMREIQKNGKVIGLDRVTVMAALNIAHELIELRNEQNQDRLLADTLPRLQDKVDHALARVQQLEF